MPSTGPHTLGPKKILWAQNTDETVTRRLWLLANGWEAKWSFIRENREKTEEPSWGPSDNGATPRHDSSARYIYPMTQGSRPWGACRSCGTIRRKLSRGPGPFLVVSPYNTIWTHGVRMRQLRQRPKEKKVDSRPFYIISSRRRRRKHTGEAS